ncbi:hypothetical protein NLG97_g8788 [Lecanicillium saksenae]|uniref:Uncharacterized protein n=1 Tax=Lecanicillium saksenae TaxID=468837 RepID=A0ACC1QJA5_9HYPO|nr:hypothetical protein NLG97_g8788 [Lecanicillium saksenae]
MEIRWQFFQNTATYTQFTTANIFGAPTIADEDSRFHTTPHEMSMAPALVRDPAGQLLLMGPNGVTINSTAGPPDWRLFDIQQTGSISITQLEPGYHGIHETLARRRNMSVTTRRSVTTGMPPKAFVVGYSSVNFSPIIMREQRRGAAPQATAGSFAGASLNRTPGMEIAGGKTILLYDLAVPGTVSGLKALISAPDAAAAATILAGTDIGTAPALAALADSVLQDVALGRPTRGCALINAIHAHHAGQNPSTRPIMTIPGGPGNRTFGSVTPALGQFWARQAREGFRLDLAPIIATEFPYQLLDKIEAFASIYPHDIIHPTVALVATVLWIDIMMHSSLMQEALERNGNSVPAVDLDVFILYLPHFLRYTEEYRLLYYIHPFRFTARALERAVQRSVQHEVPSGFLEFDDVAWNLLGENDHLVGLF